MNNRIVNLIFPIILFILLCVAVIAVATAPRMTESGDAGTTERQTVNGQTDPPSGPPEVPPELLPENNGSETDRPETDPTETNPPETDPADAADPGTDPAPDTDASDSHTWITSFDGMTAERPPLMSYVCGSTSQRDV